MKPTLRCSEADRVLRCNGSLRLTRLVDARESGPEAVMGQGVHFLAHDKMRRELGAVGNIGERPADMKAALNSAWIADFYVRQIKETVPADWSIEMEADLDHEFEQFILTGHPDDIAMNLEATEAMIFDLKAGYLNVDVAEINSQLLCYLCLILKAYPTLKKATLFLIQPRVDEDEGFERVSSVVVDDIPQAVRYLEAQINAAIANDMELNTGPKQCLYCPAKLQCKAVIELRAAMKTTLTKEDLERVKREPQDSVLADWYLDGKVLSGAIDDATKLAKERIKATGSIESSDGTRLGVKVEGGAYSYPSMDAYFEAHKLVLPDESSIPRCWKPSKTATIEEIARVRGVKKTGKDSVTATSIYDGHFRSYVVQGERVKIVELV